MIKVLMILLAGVVFATQIYAIDTSELGLSLYYHSKQYQIMQYERTSDLIIYSLWRLYDPVPLVLIKDKNRKIIKAINNENSSFWADITLYDLNKDGFEDIILFWNAGPSGAQIIEVWINKNNEDFELNENNFAGKGAEFKVEDGVPTLVLHAYHDSRIKEETYIYKWNGSFFDEYAIQFGVHA